MSNLKPSLFIAILLVGVPTAFSYDYLKLALQWPPTVSSDKQLYRSPMDFTIHGVWPENFLGPWPLPPCPLQNPYASITDPKLLSRLQVSWPNLRGSNDWFWGHEWNKHGGCSEAVYNQTQYFELGLELKDRYDVQKMLGLSFIFPGLRVLLSNIDSTIRYRFHKKAEFGCNQGPVF
ncbi:hypothetical protein RHSIM_Rhsim10G0057700 [Rhododendron simsii]|uniref:Uncharacterized protein n=1 Tax=Rhododendron simsii TaxID=118357 RepID=A0A834G9Z9_RHOSS|nr:hypothetical protein RHSIM_Rhsim10G0057700 [Rhododendron simsii]